MNWLANWYLALAVATALCSVASAVEVLDPLRHFIHPNTNDLDSALWELARRDGHCSSETVLVVGSSVAREAFDPDRMTSSLKRPVFNVALSNAQILDVEQELLLCPGVGTVVLAVNGFNFDERMTRDPTYPWNRPAGPYLVVRRAELQVLIEHRLRSLARHLASRARDDVAEGRACRLTRYVSRMSMAELRKARGEMSREYPDDGRDRTSANFDALARITKRLKNAHSNLVVVWLPELPEGKWYPFERSRERLHAQLASSGVRFLDLISMPLPPSDYHDFHHVLARGREKLTDHVSQALQQPSP